MTLLEPWGYHTYNGQAWFNPFEALDDAVAHGITAPQIEFVFPLANKIDWTSDPFETLDELYANRAEKLRSEYDYLILMYSGGSDSHQILKTCLKHGIFLNEVRTCFPMRWVGKVFGKTTSDDPLGVLYEFENAVAPALKLVKKESPMTRITVKDTTDAYTTNGMQEWYKALWGSRMSGGLHGLFQAIRRTRIASDLQEDAKQIAGRVGVIIGAEKPPMVLDGSNLYVCFHDTGRIGIEHFWQHGESIAYEPHMFYWGDPKIVCKQVHKIKRVLEIDPTIIGKVDVHKNVIYPDQPKHFQSEPVYGGLLAEFIGPRALNVAAARTKYYNERYKTISTVEKMTDDPPRKGHLKRSLLLSRQTRRYHVAELRLHNMGRSHDGA